MEAPNAVMHYLAVLKAARDFGLDQRDIESVAGRFDARSPRAEQLADALADLLLSRRSIPPTPAGCSG